MPLYCLLVRPHQESHVKFWVLDMNLEIGKQGTFNREQPYQKGFGNCELSVSQEGTGVLNLEKRRGRIIAVFI